MLKNLLKNKKIVTVIVALVIVMAGVVIAVMMSRDVRKSPQTDNESEQSEEKDEAYDGEGLEILDEIDGSIDSVDGSGDWDTPSDAANQDTPDTGNQKDETQTSDTESNDGEEQDSENKDSDEDILIDDKEWGMPS